MHKKEVTYRVDSNGCWICTSHQPNSDEGYYTIMRDGKKQRLHRWMYEQKFGPMPDDLLGCHTCDNAFCINPDHIYAGTQSNNMQDAASRGRMNWNKLTSAKRKAIQESDKSYLELANKYSVSIGLIRKIKRNCGILV